MLERIKYAFNEMNALREYKKIIPQIHRRTKNLKAEALVDFVMSDEWKRFFWMIQIPSEIKWLLSNVEKIQPKVVVEIGTRMGGTLFLFTKVASPDARIVSIDFPDGQGGGYRRSRQAFYRDFAVPPQNLHLIKGDSHRLETLEQLKGCLNGEKIDFLFIDGDHAYDGVKMDFEMYGSLVRPGGLVGFHDNKATKENEWSGVIPYWDEIKTKYKSREFFGPEDSWGGMGLIEMP
jgi:predicted O-methyltransferase YrrM